MRELDSDGNSTLELDEFMEAAAARVLDTGLAEGDLTRLLEGLLASVLAEAARSSEDGRVSSAEEREVPVATVDVFASPTLHRPPRARRGEDEEEEEEEDEDDGVRSESSGALSIPVTHLSRGSSSAKRP